MAGEGIQGHIIDLITLERLAFHYTPTPIRDSREPQYSEATVIGHSHTRPQFVNGGPRTVSFTLQWYWRTDRVDEVKAKCDWLRSLTYPERGSSGALQGAPHPVSLALGDLFRAEQWLVKTVRTQYGDIFDASSYLPKMATTEIDLVEWVQDSVSYRTVRQKNDTPDGFPGSTRDFLAGELVGPPLIGS